MRQSQHSQLPPPSVSDKCCRCTQTETGVAVAAKPGAQASTFEFCQITIKVMQWRKKAERDDDKARAHVLGHRRRALVEEVRENRSGRKSREHARAAVHRHAERVFASIEKNQRRADTERRVEQIRQAAAKTRRESSRNVVRPVRNPIITSPAPINASTIRTSTSNGEATICSSTK